MVFFGGGVQGLRVQGARELGFLRFPRTKTGKVCAPENEKTGERLLLRPKSTLKAGGFGGLGYISPKRLKAPYSAPKQGVHATLEERRRCRVVCFESLLREGCVASKNYAATLSNAACV